MSLLSALGERVPLRVRIVLGSALAALFLGATVLFLGSGPVVEALAQVRLPLLALAGLVYLAQWPVRGLRYRLILARMGHPVGLGLSTGSIFLSQSANVILPLRLGDLARAYILHRRSGVGYAEGVGSLVVERIFDTLALVAIGGLSAWGLLGRLLVPHELWSKFVLFGVVLLGFFGVLLLFLLRRRPVLPGPGRVVGFVNRLLDGLQKASLHPLSFLLVAGLSLAVWAIEVVTTTLVLVSLGAAPTPVLPVLVAFALTIASLFTTLPVTQGGIGIYEGSLAGALILGSIPRGLAGATALLDHALKIAVTVAGAGVSLYLLHLRLSEVLEKPGEAPGVPYLAGPPPGEKR